MFKTNIKIKINILNKLPLSNVAHVPLYKLLIPPSEYKFLITLIGPLYFWLPLSCTCKIHLIRSPGTIIIAVKIPEKEPAQNNRNVDKLLLESPEAENTFFPTPNPKKLIANIGATPVIGAAIPKKI